MKTIDRYVIRIFLSVLIGSMAAIVLIFIVLNLTDNMERFIETGAPLKAPVLGPRPLLPQFRAVHHRSDPAGRDAPGQPLHHRQPGEIE